MPWKITKNDGSELKVKKIGPGAQVDYEHQFDGDPYWRISLLGHTERNAFALWAQLRRQGTPDIPEEFDQFLDSLAEIFYVDPDETRPKRLFDALQEAGLIAKGKLIVEFMKVLEQVNKDEELEQSAKAEEAVDAVAELESSGKAPAA
jgi:hypothetical protein